MNLRIVVLPAKVAADGTHKVRIAISHNRTTRYFLTRFFVPSPKNISNGQVVGVPNAAYVNQQLRNQMTKIYQAFDKIEDADYLSCSQLITAIEKMQEQRKPKTLVEVADEYLQVRKGSISPGSYDIYEDGINYIKSFFDSALLIQHLNSVNIGEYKEYLSSKNLSPTTVGIRLMTLRNIIKYAERHKYASFDVSPYADVSMPKTSIRQCAISLPQLRALRDMTFDDTVQGQGMRFNRDFFMLSFYLCGMNLVDLLQVDLSGEKVSFSRQKNRRSKSKNYNTEFTIQPEARHYIDALIGQDGRLGGAPYCKGTYVAISSSFLRYMRPLGDAIGFDGKLVFYSARKTFAQLANELMIKDSVIEYCIGDSISQSKVIGHYIHVTQKMADRAIRKVFDAVASDKTLDELIDESI